MGLAEYHSEMRNYSFPGELEDWDEFGWIELTPQEQKLLSLQGNNRDSVDSSC